MLNNPPQPEDADILDEPGEVDANPVPASDGGASGASGAVAVESTGVPPPVADDSGDSSPLRVKRTRPASGRDAAGDGKDLPAVVQPVVTCPPPPASKKRGFRILLRPGAAPAGLVYSSTLLFLAFISLAGVLKVTDL